MNTPTLKNTHKFRPVTAAMAVVAVLFGILAWVYPFAIDDIWFFPEGTEPGTWDCFVQTLSGATEHWFNDNGRFSNIAQAPFLSLFPRWVFAATVGFCIFAIMVLGLRLMRAGALSLQGAIWVMVIGFVLPWFELMFTICYSTNYIFESALALFVTAVFLDRLRHRVPLWLAVVAAFFCGWWHEGLAVPLIGGLAVWLLVAGRNEWTRRRLIILGALVAGFIVILCMPAFWAMIGEIRPRFMWHKTVWTETVLYIGVLNCMFYIFVAVLFAVLCVRRWRRRLFSDRQRLAAVLFLAAFGFLAFLIYFVYYNGARTAFFSQIYCSIGLLALVPVIWPRIAGLKFRGVFTWLALAATATSLVFAIKVQTRLSDEFYTAQREFSAAQARGEDFIFLDFTPVTVGPDALKASYILISFHTDQCGMTIIPEDYADFGGEADAATRRCSDPRVVMWNGQLATDCDLPAERFDIMVTDADGHEERSRVRIRKFTAPDGTRWAAILPNITQMNPLFTITDARLLY